VSCLTRAVTEYLTKSLQTSEETNNPAYNLMTDKRQPVLDC